MDADDYQRRALAYLNPGVAENGPDELLVNAALGLCGEAGEVADLVKKWRHQGHPLDAAAVRKEAGDIAWYLAVLCRALDAPLSAVLAENLDKLARRYAGGRFTVAESLHRAEDAR